MSFPKVPLSFIFLVIVLAVVGWLAWPKDKWPPIMKGSHETFKVFRVPNGTLTTSGMTKTEQLEKSDSTWRGTTSSVIRVEATYVYGVTLSPDWKFVFDERRKIAFVLAPPLTPQLPVAIDTKTLQEQTSSGWLRFDKNDYLTELRKEITPVLDRKAQSENYIAPCREEARKTVAEFVTNWILKEMGWRETDRPVVEVKFQDEENICFPSGTNLKTFLP